MFLSDVEFQDQEYFNTKTKLKLIEDGYILPVVASKKEVELEKEVEFTITNTETLYKLFDGIHEGKFANHTSLTVHFGKLMICCVMSRRGSMVCNQAIPECDGVHSFPQVGAFNHAL